MELRVLRYFLAVAREENITAAAESLHITQPTLSKQLMDLESELGTKLFERGKRKITLTEAGVYLRQRAQEIIDLSDKTIEAFEVDQKTVAGDIYIGCGETQGMKDVIQTIKKINAQYPHIHFHFFSGNDEDVSEKLDKGLIDFGLFVGKTNLDRYDHLKLRKFDTWGLIMRSDDNLASKQTVTPSDLDGIPLICTRQALSQNEFSGWLGRNASELNIIATYNLIYNATLMVEGGMGCAVALDGLTDKTNDKLTFRPFEPQMRADLYFAWKKFALLSKPAELFLNQLKALL